MRSHLVSMVMTSPGKKLKAFGAGEYFSVECSEAGCIWPARTSCSKQTWVWGFNNKALLKVTNELGSPLSKKQPHFCRARPQGTHHWKILYADLDQSTFWCCKEEWTSQVVLDFPLLHHCPRIIDSIKLISKALYLGKYLLIENLKQKPSVWISWVILETFPYVQRCFRVQVQHTVGAVGALGPALSTWPNVIIILKGTLLSPWSSLISFPNCNPPNLVLKQQQKNAWSETQERDEKYASVCNRKHQLV